MKLSAGVIAAALGALFLLCSCAPVAPTGPAPSPASTAENGRPKPDAAARATCVGAGGNYTQVGMMGTWFCVTQYPDAGSVCTDKSQCTGACIFAGSSIPAPNAEVQGSCQRTNAQFGCFSMVEGGHAQPPLCVD